jgi:hypothetical protein
MSGDRLLVKFVLTDNIRFSLLNEEIAAWLHPRVIIL